MRRYVSEKSLLIRKILIVLTAVIIAVALLLNYRIAQYADIICTSSCISYGEDIINNAVQNTLDSFDFSAIVEGENGTFVCRSEIINDISAFLINEIQSSLADEYHGGVNVPVGAFTGISFLSGAGPDINIDIFSVASPDVNIESRFSDAGINQTLFELYVTVSIDFCAVMPDGNVPVVVSRKILLAQRVFSGDVPQVYLPELQE